MNEQENTQLVKQAYAQFLRGDISGLLETMHDDVQWELPHIENVSFSGARRGKDQVAQFFSELNRQQQALQFEPREYVAQGDKVIVLGHYAWTVKSTDRRYEGDWVHVFTVRDGKLAAFREFGDTAAVEKAYRQA
jgi:ketosteroid isomerase-like protein